MGETITIRTGAATEVIKVIEQGPQGPVGPKGDPGDVAGLPLTTTGDTLYRAASGQNARLAIGTSGQVLKVANGIPAWGNESGAVTSVNGATGAVTVAALNHTHEAADVFFQGLELLDAGNANTNGVYVYGGVFGGKGIYYKDKDSFIYWDGAAWMVSYNSDDIYSSAQNTTTPWQVTSWSVEVGQTSPAPSSWDRLTGDQWEAVVGQRINPTLRGTAAGKNVGTGANDVAAGNDSRFTDARQPTLHASTHHTGETDALAAHQINGQTIFSVSSVVYSADQTLPANRARQIAISNTNASGITVTLPTQAEGTLVGDTYVIVGGSTMSGPITVRSVANLSPLVYNTLVTITATGQQYRLRAGGGSSGNWSLIPVDTHTHTGAQVNVGTTANLPLKTGTNGVVEAGSFGTAAGQFAEGNHVHAAADVTSGTFDNARINFAAPAAIGNTTPNTLAGTQLALHDGSDIGTFVAASKLSANRTYDLPDASGTIALTGQLTDTKAYTANDTWTKPAGAKMVHYILIGGGGGGGAGRRNAAGNSLGGGGGGAGAGLTTNFVNASFLGSTETITIGAGGAGAADSADSTNGANGTAGGDSSIGSSIIAKGGNGGTGGTFSGGLAGTATTLASLFYGTNSSTSIGSAGAPNSTTPASQAPTSLFLPSGGGGGGSRHSATNVLGGKGGDIGQTNTGITAAPAIATGTAGPNGITSHSNYAGIGGGGGSMENSDNSGRAGGNGGLYGGGGGGGSGAVNSAGGSTAGGTGANGIVIITTYF